MSDDGYGLQGAGMSDRLLNAKAREAVEAAWLSLVQRKNPDFVATLRSPGSKRDAMPATREIVGSLAAHEDDGALTDGLKFPRAA